LAVLTDNYKLIPAYKNGIYGVAKSAATSLAVKHVAEKLGIGYYEVPTGWKYFINLMNSNRITFCGEDFSTYSIKERAEHVGYVMQNPNAMISQVMIYDEVAFGLKNRGIPQDEIDRRVEEALRVCGLWRMRKWPISALSFGQKKRVTIASILVLGPEMIILDEPTAGQDYKHYTDIMEFLLELHAKGITIVMITHEPDIANCAKRVMYIRDGQLHKGAFNTRDHKEEAEQSAEAPAENISLQKDDRKQEAKA
jgi:energy-coupling factor transporter ATP-binding protein EcfA2